MRNRIVGSIFVVMTLLIFSLYSRLSKTAFSVSPVHNPQKFFPHY